jgi:lipopolysaccharide transport protein LptA/LPS export ABC transporter protein LptC
MTNRNVIVYLAGAFIVAIFLTSIYFFAKKPHTPAPTRPEDAQKVLVFKDVKYTGERKGVVDWEIRAKVMRQDLKEMQVVKLEGVEGEYKPQAGSVVSFKGSKGAYDREKGFANVEDVEVYYKGEYTIKSPSIDIDFQKSLAHTDSPVDLTGKKMAMMGVGLDADMKEQVIRLRKDVSGTLKTEKQKIRFSSDTFVYAVKDNTYLFEGKVVVKSEQIDVICDRIRVLSDGETVEKADATGHVRILLPKGAIAKSERAVYYLREDRVVLEQEPKVIRESGEMTGETITYDVKKDQFFVQKPKVRIEQQPRRSDKDKG